MQKKRVIIGTFTFIILIFISVAISDAAEIASNDLTYYVRIDRKVSCAITIRGNGEIAVNLINAKEPDKSIIYHAVLREGVVVKSEIHTYSRVRVNNANYPAEEVKEMPWIFDEKCLEAIINKRLPLEVLAKFNGALGMPQILSGR